jgi:hypothetical protein
MLAARAFAKGVEADAHAAEEAALLGPRLVEAGVVRSQCDDQEVGRAVAVCGRVGHDVRHRGTHRAQAEQVQCPGRECSRGGLRELLTGRETATPVVHFGHAAVSGGFAKGEVISGIGVALEFPRVA